jgi:hypothetical protein
MVAILDAVVFRGGVPLQGKQWFTIPKIGSVLMNVVVSECDSYATLITIVDQQKLTEAQLKIAENQWNYFSYDEPDKADLISHLLEDFNKKQQASKNTQLVNLQLV